MRRLFSTPAIVAIVIALALGYAIGSLGAVGDTALSGSVPAPGSVQVLYSLDQKQNDRALISLIDGARDHIYFAIYEFTLADVADALIRAKERGVDVRGIVDRENSTESYEAPIIAKLEAAGIPIETQQHAGGIMHIKALVTDSAYASGSYNWTASATDENDEVLEIGTDPALRARYESIISGLLSANAGSTAGAAQAAPSAAGAIAYTQAGAHIGETASVTGMVLDVYTSSGGTVFLDYCQDYDSCPFSAVIFADDASRFSDLARLEGKTVTLTGAISSYQGRAEIILHDPSQIASMQ
ncbi:MAG TPA: phospholipase D-like domain-containing protein [Candidatus Paceibacterota bacterium]|nr:phospholipase D-like domain-containing protein [Candidatus Paceibacterota bacterium]